MAQFCKIPHENLTFQPTFYFKDFLSEISHAVFRVNPTAICFPKNFVFLKFWKKFVKNTLKNYLKLQIISLMGRCAALLDATGTLTDPADTLERGPTGPLQDPTAPTV